ncbi:hypothetical protein SARC_12998 [Sphaeroforma arctica JP610]|uniref:Uncharacterized protein n=1 Tax=Sphaeroforma arctica JP610 TaxID=667725 RepID=A0A0L0FD92_9EUKA|nr:hypothetical protein SARC_12998 [Sphaeroforma arctica JP610]KNC74456.1 hypothetical protein SARC_12998 [Sphaeroforma arctica JP610]|eukprot:XP_014148358.1 hypothetical protein SARC_12998 [Sphaeroforma arctica JP610]
MAKWKVDLNDQQRMKYIELYQLVPDLPAPESGRKLMIVKNKTTRVLKRAAIVDDLHKTSKRNSSLKMNNCNHLSPARRSGIGRYVKNNCAPPCRGKKLSVNLMRHVAKMTGVQLSNYLNETLKKYSDTVLVPVPVIFNGCAVNRKALRSLVCPDDSTEPPEHWHYLSNGCLTSKGDRKRDPRLLPFTYPEDIRLKCTKDILKWLQDERYCGLISTIPEPQQAEYIHIDDDDDDDSNAAEINDFNSMMGRLRNTEVMYDDETAFSTRYRS